MDLSNKNGQPSMEEILASIRRIIAEEPTAANPVIDLHARHRKADDDDENNDFELPSIFRPAAPTPERQPLFGRLTDAIRNASGGGVNGAKPEGESAEQQERYRGALRDAGSILAVAGSNSLDASAVADADRYRGALRDSGGSSSLTSALSSLKLTRAGEMSPLPPRAEPAMQAPEPFAAVVPEAPAAPAPVAPPTLAAAPRPEPSPTGGVEDVRRVMVPFRDMRMSRMSGGAPSGAAAAAPAPANVSPLDSLLMSPEPAAAPSAPDFPVPPQDAFQASLPPIPAPPQPLDNGLSLDDMHRFASVVEQPRQAAPEPLMSGSAGAAGIEDATADLLRPMLRQWLAENMPRMVEKALSIELAQSVKQTRKFSGY
jgi:cell pole-organizing protein PopZ